jgi:hypothetical protein
MCLLLLLNRESKECGEYPGFFSLISAIHLYVMYISDSGRIEKKGRGTMKT